MTTTARNGIWLLVAAVLGGSAVGTGAVARRQSDTERSLLRSLPRVTALPSVYGRVAELAKHGVFYAAGAPLFRLDDGNAHHGYAVLPVWAGAKGKGAQGIVYGVQEGVITSAGYLTRQADLLAGKSFHGLTLRELDFPAARYLTVDFIKGATPDSNLYLWLWHFLPQQGRVGPMLRTGELPSSTSLPSNFGVTSCEDSPKNFCPRMGRHRRDLSVSANRLPTATGEGSVWYGEAAGKLIFIEYIFNPQDLAAGSSWPPMPLDGLPIPPIDNVHLLHYQGADGGLGRFTLHMYFIPEKTYLAWETEPEGP